MTKLADGSFVRSLFCNSRVRLIGAAVIRVGRSWAAGLMYCTSCRRVCHSLISGSLETWRQCTHGRALTLQTDSEKKVCTGTYSAHLSLQSRALFSWTCSDSCTGEERVISSSRPRLWSLQIIAGKKSPSEPVREFVLKIQCVYMRSRNYTAGIHDTLP